MVEKSTIFVFSLSSVKVFAFLFEHKEPPHAEAPARQAEVTKVFIFAEKNLC